MNQKIIYQAAMFASLLALVGIALTLIATSMLPQGVLPQPSAVPLEEYTAALEADSNAVLLFFAGDTLFPLSYLMVFAGLFAVTKSRAFVFAGMGLVLGFLTFFFDMTENAFFISFAQMSQNAAGFDPDVTLSTIITTLKWTAGFGTMYAFGIVFPRETLLEMIIVVIMIAFLLFGVLSVAVPSLIAFRGIFFLIGMPLFAAYFWQQAKQLEG